MHIAVDIDNPVEIIFFEETFQIPWLFIIAPLFFVILLGLWIFLPQKWKSRLHARMRKKKPLEIPVSLLMARDVISVDASENLREVLRTFVSLNINSVIVTKETKPVGILTEDDFLYRFDSYDERKLDEMPAGKLMSALSVAGEDEDTLLEAWRKMERSSVRKLPLFHEEKLVGILSVTDLLHYVLSLDIQLQQLPKVEKYLIKDFLKARQEIKVAELRKRMLAERQNFALVFAKEKLAGIITGKDIVDGLYSNPRFLKTALVQEVMARDVVGCKPGISLLEALRTLEDKNYKRLPVLDGERVLGFVTQEGLLSGLLGIYEQVGE